MFDRFTDDAQRVMDLARRAAQALGHDCIGTEHLLLGLLEEPTGAAARILEQLGVSPTAIRAEIERRTEQGTTPARGPQLPFTLGAKRVLEMALEEAQTLGYRLIGTEHLLLGLVREGDGAAARALGELGVSSAEIRVRMLEMLGDEPPAAATPSPPA